MNEEKFSAVSEKENDKAESLKVSKSSMWTVQCGRMNVPERLSA